jgi:hypothetical protein
MAKAGRISYEDRSMMLTMITLDPELDPVRSEPRFQAILSKMNLAH